MKDFSKLTLILFTIICLNIVSCDTTTEEKKSEEKQSTTLQNLINNATDGDTINLEEWENVTDYTATIDKKLTITSGNLNGASLTVKAENVKLEKMQNLSVETSSRLTIKDSKLNNLLLDGNAQSRNATLKINVTVENCEISEKVEINSSAKLNIAGKKTEIAKIVVAVAPEDCKILCTTEIDTTKIKNAVVDKNDKKLENVVSQAYKIIYHSNCSEIDDIEDFFSPDEGTITLPTDIFKINGHVLEGWYKDKEFTESFEDSINVSDKTADIHVYAKLGNIIGTYQLINETAKTEIKDNGSFITTTADNKTMNGTWEKAERGYTFTFGGDYKGMTGTTRIVEYDVVKMFCADMEIDSYAVKKSNENVDLSGTWTDGNYTIVITSDNTFNIETEEGGALSGTVEQTGNCFTLTLTDNNDDFSTGAVSASGKAYICSTANNSQSIYTKK